MLNKVEKSNKCRIQDALLFLEGGFLQEMLSAYSKPHQ